jgi:hypothetical protein
MRAVALLVPVLASSLAGQRIVSPSHFAIAEGGTSNPNPLGVTETLVRYQQIHEDLPVGPQAIGALSLRRNSDATSFPAFSIEADLICSLPSTAAAAPDPVFANNHDSHTQRQVATQRRYDFPATGPCTNLPQPLDYRLPFDQPFTCGQRLCWELQILARTNASLVHFDSVPRTATGNANPLPSVLTFGTGCIPSGRTLPFQATGSAQMDWPNSSAA